MHVLVTGATGLVGRKVCQKFLELGYNLTVIGRSDEKKFRKNFSFPCNYLTWTNVKAFSAKSIKVNKFDVVVHLSGESIADGKWTKSKKERIYNSRVEKTRLLVRFLLENSLEPEVFISASATGFYGESKSENAFTEADKPGGGFLAEVCIDWEGASKKIKKVSRLVHLRFGLVFDNSGGFLAEMEPIFSKGVGGKIASGNQWMSWVHIDDLVNTIVYSVENKNLQGPVNVVAPEPVRNKEWTKEFAKVLKMPALFTVPKIALKIGLGEKAILALQSQKVVPDKLLKTNFNFEYPNVKKCLQNLYAWKKKSTDQLFEEKIWLNHSIEKVFDFFADEKNLESITPKELQFNVVDMSTPKITKGTEIKYKLKIHGVPAKWKTKITVWDPPSTFVDNQESGPYSKWHHTHSFHNLKGGTLMNDRVIYRLPFGLLGSLIASRFVKNDIKNIFSHRQNTIVALFPKE